MNSVFRSVVTVLSSLALPATLFAAEVVIEYKDSPDKSEAQPLLDSGVLEDGIGFINEAFTLKRDIKIILGAEDGPLYDPSTSEIHMPYHFYIEVLDRIAGLESDIEEQELFANDAMLHTLYHELGHALVDQLELPVVGKEEDAVDGLASMLLLEYYEEGASMAANAAELFALEGEDRGKLEEADFWDEHSLDEQRYYSTLCHIVGSDPDKYQGMADDIGFSEDRVAFCEESYERMVYDWETLLDDSFRP
ncbi:MAG: DUF4344 domain-containing metallopeptidase [Pseudomonadota bacterium]